VGEEKGREKEDEGKGEEGCPQLGSLDPPVLRTDEQLIAAVPDIEKLSG